MWSACQTRLARVQARPEATAVWAAGEPGQASV